MLDFEGKHGHSSLTLSKILVFPNAHQCNWLSRSKMPNHPIERENIEENLCYDEASRKGSVPLKMMAEARSGGWCGVATRLRQHFFKV